MLTDIVLSNTNPLLGISDLFDVNGIPYKIIDLHQYMGKEISIPFFIWHEHEKKLMYFANSTAFEKAKEKLSLKSGSKQVALLFQTSEKRSIFDNRKFYYDVFLFFVKVIITSSVILMLFFTFQKSTSSGWDILFCTISLLLLASSLIIDNTSKRVHEYDGFKLLCAFGKEESKNSCDSLMWSRDSFIPGMDLKISELGVIYALLLFILSVSVKLSGLDIFTYPSFLVLFPVGLLISLLFVFKQIRINRYCIWCNLIHGFNFLLGFIFIWNAQSPVGFHMDQLQPTLITLAVTFVIFLWFKQHQEITKLEHKNRQFKKKISEDLAMEAQSGTYVFMEGDVPLGNFNPVNNTMLVLVSLKCGECDELMSRLSKFTNQIEGVNVVVRIAVHGYTEEINEYLGSIYSYVDQPEGMKNHLFEYFTNKEITMSRSLKFGDRKDYAYIISNQKNWLANSKLKSTPRILVNGVVLPKEYEFEDGLLVAKYLERKRNSTNGTTTKRIANSLHKK